MMDGRLKTLHPKVHGGLLAVRGNAEHDARGRGARHRADRPAGGQPLSLRGDRGEGRALRGVRREHRHRRPGHDPRRGQEPRRRHGRGRAGGLRARAGRAWRRTAAPPASTLRKALAAKAYARTAAYDAAIGGWFADDAGRARAALARLRRPARAGAALRREPASAGRLLRVGRARARAWRPPCSTRARSSPTTTSTTPTPPSSWWPSSIPKISPAVAIIKHANPCGVALGAHAGGGLRQGAALRSRQRLRRHHRAQRPDRRGDGRARSPGIFTEVVIAPDATRRGQGDLRRKEEPAAADHGRPARSARAGARLPLARRRLPGAVARQRRGRRPAS